LHPPPKTPKKKGTQVKCGGGCLVFFFKKIFGREEQMNNDHLIQKSASGCHALPNRILKE